MQKNKTLLAFLDDVYEDLELWYPKLRLEEAGYRAEMRRAGNQDLHRQARLSRHAGFAAEGRERDDFCGLLVPGGFMPDKLRRDPKVLSLTREFYEEDKLVAFICHGGWIPISAKILKGKRVTGSLGIKDDLENAGGLWVNEPVVEDGNLISSRTPRDLAPFGTRWCRFLDAKRAMNDLGKFLVLVGLLIAAIGALLWSGWAKAGLAGCPATSIIPRAISVFIFPIVTCLVISVVLTVLMWLFRK